MIAVDLNELNNSGYNNITKTCLSSNKINNLESEIVFPKSNPKIEIGGFRETDKNYPDVCRRTLRQNNK